MVLGVVGFVWAVASWASVQHLKEIPLRAARLGFSLHRGVYEQTFGRAVLRFASTGPENVVLSLDLREIVGTALCLRKRALFSSKRLVTGETALDQGFDIQDPLAATAFLAPFSDLICGFFADLGPSESLECDHGVFIFTAKGREATKASEGWITRLRMLANTIDNGQLGADVMLRRNLMAMDPGLRLRSLQLLESSFPGSAVHKSAIADAAEDTDHAVRIEAARQRRDAQTLRTIALDDTVDAELRALAVDAHGRVTKAPAHVALLKELVTDREERLSLLAIKELKALRAPDLAKRFVRLLDVAKGPRQRALLDALVRLGDPSIESALADFFERLDDEGKRIACQVFGRFGSVKSVALLRRTAENASAITGRALRQEAEQAIAMIQSRTHGAEAGQVSVVSGGEVSVVGKKP